MVEHHADELSLGTACRNGDRAASADRAEVGEIANSCGFQTSQHFSRRVRQVTGLTPLEVREQS
ncbi:MAG: helix-turn-helix domain-containing protein [Ktedonobacteraceae bacterium]